MILLSFASRQIWPQVLAVLHARPERLVLFHSAEEHESLHPAERIKSFFEAAEVVPRPKVELRHVPHDRFRDIVDVLANTAEELGLDEHNCQVHLSGGNKMMALAATEWCRLAGVGSVYLERELRVFRFTTKGPDLLPQAEFKLDPHLARDLDPVALLRCQFDGAEIVSPGQSLVLSDLGEAVDEVEIQSGLDRSGAGRENLEPYLHASGPRPKESNTGDYLELATAFVLLKLGVPMVQRGVRLRSGMNRGHRQEEGELDLVFNWAGKLWVVDCKQRITPDSRANRLREALARNGYLAPEVLELVDRIQEELREKELKPLKEDLLVVAEAGGLLGRALAVRWHPLPPEAMEFARSRRLPVIFREALVQDLRSQLYPDQPASLDQLRSLAKARTTARA